MATKRTLDANASAGKKSRSVNLLRLCDLPSGADLFANKFQSSRAREKGILRSRDAQGKYEELEKKLFLLFAESGDVEFPEEEWVFEVLPELNDLEPDTLDALLTQAQRHAKYERAARELVLHERTVLDGEHAAEIRSLHVNYDSESTRKSVGAEMKLRELDEKAREDQEELRNDAIEKMRQLEETIEDLEEQLERQKEMTREVEEEREAECERLREEGLGIVAKLREAEEETDLKRTASRKLKEEIIDNDRLTVANLNRIKHLEGQLEQHKGAVDELEAENAELRGELGRSAQTAESVNELEEEREALRELLAERESQLMSLSQRLSEALGGGDVGGLRKTVGADRFNFLDRFGLGAKKQFLDRNNENMGVGAF